ncbi:MAG TPA: CDP-diacylglycerol--serine O-phosphatidyltransferase [Bacteroidales bacterium]|nr:CDP-diacylglycerol--serine O-phosphatidyltransferase [Bacteroidales bacterium]
MKHIPNLITSLNLVSGFFAIVFAASGDVVGASWLIVAAMIFDYFDGFAARLLKSYSDMGKELDSLADAVSFGVAPGFIILRLMSNLQSADTILLIPNEFQISSVLLLIPVIMPVCAALRLARFNIDPTQGTTFRGLPAPANGIGVISLVLAFNFSASPAIGYIMNSPVWLSVYTLLLSFLMVSRIKLLSLKISGFGFKENRGRYLLVALIALSLLLLGIKALPLVIPLYLVASIVEYYILNQS